MSGEWISPSEAANMVFLDPAGATEGFSFGILRRELRGKSNDLVGYVRAKLQPVRPADAEEDPAGWPVTAAAWCLLLASGVPDEHARPELLFPLYQEALLDREKALLVTMTLRFPEARFRHEMIEEARAFALDRMVRHRRLSTLIALHIPGETGSTNEPHVHLVSLVREHHAWGFGSYVRGVIDRAAHALLFAEWQAHRAAWRTTAP